MRFSRRLAFLAWLFLATQAGGDAPETAALPDLGPAPAFDLLSSDGERLALGALRGRVVVVTFLYTWCPDICPLLTSKLARVRDALGPVVTEDVVFVSITFDPVRDTADVLRDYAALFEIDTGGWFFLTGAAKHINTVTADYGVVTLPGADGAIDHNLTTTLIGREGRMRVQYAGYRFDEDELHRDLLSLVAERP